MWFYVCCRLHSAAATMSISLRYPNSHVCCTAQWSRILNLRNESTICRIWLRQAGSLTCSVGNWRLGARLDVRAPSATDSDCMLAICPANFCWSYLLNNGLESSCSSYSSSVWLSSSFILIELCVLLTALPGSAHSIRYLGITLLKLLASNSWRSSQSPR